MNASQEYQAFIDETMTRKIKRELPQMQAHGRIRNIAVAVQYAGTYDIEKCFVKVFMHDGTILYFEEPSLNFPSNELLAKLMLMQ